MEVVFVAHVAILEPDRHRSRVDFLDDTEAPDIEFRVGAETGDGAAVLAVQIFAVEYRVCLLYTSDAADE